MAVRKEPGKIKECKEPGEKPGKISQGICRQILMKKVEVLPVSCYT